MTTLDHRLSHSMHFVTVPLVLSIQSHVAYGHVGNAAAAFALQRLGVQAVPVHTVQFSNHTGYGAFRGQVFDADHVRDVIEGLRDRGVLARCDAVLSGYVGDPAIGAAIVDAVASVRAARPGARYACDPVMGDVGRGLFVRAGIPEFFGTSALPVADLVTPNQFEFETLIGRTLDSVDDAVACARALAGRGPARVGITSLRTPDLPADQLATLLVVRDGAAWCVQTPYLPLDPAPNGMGDVFTAVLLARLLRGEPDDVALAATVATLYSLVERTPRGARDLPLVEHQAMLVDPPRRFAARRIG